MINYSIYFESRYKTFSCLGSNKDIDEVMFTPVVQPGSGVIIRKKKETVTRLISQYIQHVYMLSRRQTAHTCVNVGVMKEN